MQLYGARPTIDASFPGKMIWHVLTAAERRRALSLLALMAVCGVLETVGVGVVLPAIALLANADFALRVAAMAWLPASLRTEPVRVAALGLAAVALTYAIKALVVMRLVHMQYSFAYNLQTRLSGTLFGIYLRQPYAFHLQRNSAQLIQNSLTSVETFTEYALLPSFVLVAEGIVFIGIVTLLLVLEPVTALFSLTVVTTSAWLIYRVVRRRLSELGEVAKHNDGLRIQHLQQGLAGVKEVKLFGREAEFEMRYNVHNVQVARANMVHRTLMQLPRNALELQGVIVLTAILGILLINGRSPATVLPALGLFGAAAFRLIPSANRAVVALEGLRFSAPVVRTLDHDLALRDQVAWNPKPKAFGFTTDIELRSVTFVYPGSVTPALEDVSLRVRAHEAIGIMGPSGAGKSTLVDVLLGMLDSTAGTVLVDGRAISSNVRGWQECIGYVPQAIYLTDDTIRNNVAFGVPSTAVAETALRYAIGAAQLDEWVSRLPKGLDTVVGDRGVRLSGGQRQRIGIARALYRNPKLLVLDEATSALDPAMEQEFMSAVRSLRGKLTMIIVSHRAEAVADCDRIYTLQQGHMVADMALV